MARKRQEIALQATIETQEEWEENLGKEGLTGNKYMSGYVKSRKKLK